MAGINDRTNERGASLVSYVVLVALIAMVAVVGLSRVGRSVDDQFTDTGEALRAPSTNVAADEDPFIDAVPDDDTADSGSGTDDGSDAVSAGGSEGSGGSGGAGGDAAAPTGDGSGGSNEGTATTTTTVATTTTTTAPTTTTTAPEDQDASDPSGDEEDLVSGIASFQGQFAVVFNVIDGRVAIGSVASPGWRYDIVRERDQRLHLQFTKYETGETVLVKGWINAHGVLKTKVED